MEKVVSRFLRYVRIHTESDPSAPPGVLPSAAREFDLARLLVDELRELGLTDAHVDEHCYVYATLPATPGCGALPVIGLLAHMDTSPDLTGKDVNPQILHYDGGELVINRELGVVMDAEHFPELDRFLGEDLIFADGRTLLGADDKGGIAVILQALEDLIAAGTPHGTVKVAFTPDEEIGRGPLGFDIPGFGADFAYTLDGPAPNEYAYETFNAAQAQVTLTGLSVHPGSSKGLMKSALLMSMDFNALLSPLETPFHTDGREGFFHLLSLTGNVEETRMIYLIRDHDSARFAERKAVMEKAAEELRRRWGSDCIRLEITDQYPNMAKWLEDKPEIVALAVAAMRLAGVEDPVAVAIRGGTDGSQLTSKGLPCPNLPCGTQYAHGRYEFVSVQALTTCKEMVRHLVSADLVKRVMAEKL
ncbi:peptidase T [Intestinimonas butyriciproducens]|uniref:peptidase T n=1 Tax=Intestinimonas butyriciproducens TaxID=1297617 RepID=UPI001AB04171|nr:peptidase T [Intestinimonas butyriciproducens]MBO3280707.1 peptidase T [Intestinimonas butyriciproducens]